MELLIVNGSFAVRDQAGKLTKLAANTVFMLMSLENLKALPKVCL